MIQLDIIGTLFAATQFDDQGEPLPPIALDGYHVNATHTVDDWAAQQITPASPSRTFGSLPTVFYSFADQAEFDAAMETVDLTLPVRQIIPDASPRQIRMALSRAGLRSQVEAAVAAGSQDMQDWYEFSTVFERDNSQVSAMGSALAVDAESLDNLWLLAATL